MISEHQLTVRGLRIRAQSAGEGVPLLLHSGVWNEMHQWGSLLEHLDGFRVITYDAPGVGLSQVPSSPMTMRALADIGAGVLDQLGVGCAHVLGVSFGGAVAQQMALSHPGRVDRLILASTSFGAFAMPGNLSAMLHMMHPRGYHPDRLARNAGAMFGGRMRTEPEFASGLNMTKPDSLFAALYRLSALAGWTSLHRLSSIPHDTLVLCGDDDPVTPHVNHRVMARLIPSARLHTVVGGGHLVLLDSAHEIGPVITAFLHGADEREDLRAA
ncbi:MAG: alpha/beta fold hydrolase [Streptosporangiaceae bacterium]|jgi:pimeloyl-ACP methyl ester carboxylesterase